MGAKDIVTKDYTEDCKIFADAFNQLIYEGEQVIKPGKLKPLDPTMIGVPYGADGAGIPTQKFRDGLKSRKSGDTTDTPKKLGNGEYLSGFYKDDRLIPVITLVIFFGAGEWDGPMTLHDMMAVKDPKILSFVSDYKINLIAPANMTDEELDRFTTSLREVMLFIKYSKDKDRLNEMLQNDQRFRTVDRKAATVISTVTGSKFEVEDEEEEVDMCQAIQEMIEDANKEERTAMAKRLLGKGKFPYEEIAELSLLTVEEVQVLAEASRKSEE